MLTGQQRKLSLVILDDDPSIVRLVEKYVQNSFSEQFEINSFTSPDEARDWIDQSNCNILISDIEMPGTDGLEVLKFVKQRNAWTQVIFMTAHSTWDRIVEAIENGATDYLLKPIDREELNTVLTQQSNRLMRWQQALKGTLSAARSS